MVRVVVVVVVIVKVRGEEWRWCVDPRRRRGRRNGVAPRVLREED